MKTGFGETLIKILLNDLHNKNPEHALRALEAHRLRSPYFPHISDLWPTMDAINRAECADRAGNPLLAMSVREKASTAGLNLYAPIPDLPSADTKSITSNTEGL